jgi:hypothetical protein
MLQLWSGHTVFNLVYNGDFIILTRYFLIIYSFIFNDFMEMKNVKS